MNDRESTSPPPTERGKEILSQPQGANEPLVSAARKTLYEALREPEGVLRSRWSESDDPARAFSINELFPLTLAWCAQDVTVAQDLIREALNQMKPNGFVPAWVQPDGRHSEDAMAWPTLAMCAQRVMDHGDDPTLAAFLLPRLETYLAHALERFERHGGYAWKSPEEAFIPETFDEELGTVDLCTLLLCEIDAFLELTERHERTDLVPAFLHRHRNQVRSHLNDHLWHQDEGLFRDCYINGAPIKRTTLSGFLPLLWRNLDEARQQRTLKRLHHAAGNRHQKGIGLWEQWDSDPHPTRYPALHQAFLVEAVRTTKDEKVQRVLESGLSEALSDAFTARQRIPDDLSAAQESDGKASSPRGGALVIMLLAPAVRHEEVAVEGSAFAQWLERHRLGLITVVVSLLVLVLGGVILSYQFKRGPTAVDMETKIGLAQMHYTGGRYSEAAALYEELIEAEPTSLRLHFLKANALYRDGRYAEAEEHYRMAADEDRPSPRILRNLAIALYRQDKFQEAATYFQQIIDEYSQRYPVLADQAATALEIIENRTHAGEKSHTP